MNHFWEKVERINHHLIFPAILVLLVIITLELFAHVENHYAQIAIEVADYLVITVFVIDLIFLAIKARSTKYFFKNYWLDILAVFPFSLFFGFLGGLFRLFSVSEEAVVVGQAIFHEGLEAEKAAVRAEKVLVRAGKGIRIGARLVRVFTKTRGFTRFHRKHKDRIR